MSTKRWCFKLLRQVSPEHGVLPKSYYLDKAILRDATPSELGILTDVGKAQLDGHQVAIKAFRTHGRETPEKIKRVCDLVPRRG